MRFTPVRVLAVAASLTILIAGCGSSGGSDTAKKDDSSSSKSGPAVVASTSWVAAFAKMAGATDVTVIAPNNIQHPPDYDPKPSDLAKVGDADFILLAGFEGFAKRLKEAAGSDAKVDTVTPDYDPKKLSAEVLRLAGVLGTDKAVAQKNIADYTTAYEKASAEVKDALGGSDQTVVAQMFVANWAGFAGLEVAGTYGPEPTTPGKAAELAKLKPTAVFENSHMGGGADVVAATEATKVDLINFPGDDLDLTKVIDTNAAAITEALS